MGKPAVHAATPERSLVQRMEALQHANEIRTKRAGLKRDIKAGRTRLDQLLAEPPDYIETARVFDLLLAVPHYGRVRVNQILGQVRISPSKTVHGLSDRQRAGLVERLTAPMAPATYRNDPFGPTSFQVRVLRAAQTIPLADRAHTATVADLLGTQMTTVVVAQRALTRAHYLDETGALTDKGREYIASASSGARSAA